MQECFRGGLTSTLVSQRCTSAEGDTYQWNDLSLVYVKMVLVHPLPLGKEGAHPGMMLQQLEAMVAHQVPGDYHRS